MLCDIDKLVERWNRKHETTVGSAFKGYVNGDIDLLFEYSAARDSPYYPVVQAKRLNMPRSIDTILAKPNSGIVRHPKKKIWDRLSSNISHAHLNEVADRDKCCVLSWVVEGTHEVEKIVPSRFTVGLEVNDGISELWTNLVGQSIMGRFLKPCSGFREWELNIPFFSGSGSEGADYGGICVVNGVSEVLNGVTAPQRKAIYDGFVAFGIGGSPSGLCICLKDVTEGSIFSEHFVNISDVFRGPINLEARRFEQIV